MERIPGVNLSDMLESLTDQELDYITSQLTEMFKTLREIRQPPDQWSSLPVQAQARGKSLLELRKACGLTGLLVIIDEREPWE